MSAGPGVFALSVPISVLSSGEGDGCHQSVARMSIAKSRKNHEL